IPRPPVDAAPTNDTAFETREVKCQKLTITNVLVTVLPKAAMATLEVAIAGLNAELHRDEMKPDIHSTTLSGVKPGQKPPITGQIVSSPDQTGTLAITARATNPGFAVASTETEVPFQNKNGQLK